MIRRPPGWLLALLGLLAFQLVLVFGAFMPVPHSGGDNAAYVALARALVEGVGYVETWDPLLPPHTKYPPVFPALLAVPIALGAQTWAALKAVPALFTTAAVLLAFLWSARRHGPGFGLGVGLVLAAAPGVLWHSQWILSDAPFLAFVLLALVALERSDGRPAGEAGSGERVYAPAPDPTGARGATDATAGGAVARRPSAGTAWLVVGLAAALLAAFTRTAGLPLLAAIVGWLALRRRWVPLGAFAAVAAVPGLWWVLRGRTGTDEGAYGGEFFLLDPYDPGLGTAGPADFVARVVENAMAYATQHVPAALAGPLGGGFGLVLVGTLLVLLALVGWALRLARGGRGVHVAELFLPLYAGLILLWPVVWSGDRFALPLLPLLLVYAGAALVWTVEGLRPGRATGRVGGSGRAARRRAVAEARGDRDGGARAAEGGPSRLPVRLVGAAAAAVLVVPSLFVWTQGAAQARECRQIAREAGAFACWGPPWQDFVDAAAWSGRALPDGAAVLNRKPRIFHAMGGTPGRTYPFLEDAGALFAEARAVGARYVLLDYVGPQGARFLGHALSTVPEAFCAIRAFGPPGPGARTQLLGLVDPASGQGGAITTDDAGRPALRIPPCPASMAPGAAEADAALAAGGGDTGAGGGAAATGRTSWQRIPLLTER